MITRYSFCAIVCAIFITAMTSCGSSRASSDTTVTYNKQADWSTLYASMNLNLDKPMEMGFSTRATMENNKYIHLSMRMLGIEVAALYMDNDSIFFVDKYNKYYFAEPLKFLLGSKYADMTIGDIQQIVLGQQTVPETQKVQITPSDFVSTPAGNVASLLTIVADTPQANIQGSVEWKPASAKWNEPNRKANFKLPDNYRRITPDNLKSMLKKMSF